MVDSVIQNISVGAITLYILYLVYIFMASPTITWSEWVIQGSEPTCGSGVSTYKRQCTVNSVVQATIDTCVKSLSGSDTKQVEYNFANKCPVIGRYIILERNNISGQSGSDKDVLNIAEIKAYDLSGNNLIVPGVLASAGSLLSPIYPASNLIDGNLNNFAHTVGSDKAKNWFQIDLGVDKVIGKVDIYNRKDCCQGRVVGARIRIVNSSGYTTFTSPDITANQANNISNLITFNIA